MIEQDNDPLPAIPLIESERRLAGLIGIILLVDTVLVTIWLVLLVTGTASEGTISTLEGCFAPVAGLDVSFYLSYINAALFTVVTTMLFAGLYVGIHSGSKST